MQLQTSIKTVNIKSKAKDYQMGMTEYARWLSLIEGIELVSKKAQQVRERNPSNNVDWIKPLAFQKYVTERHESMIDEIEVHEKNNINTSDMSICITLPEPVLK